MAQAAQRISFEDAAGPACSGKWSNDGAVPEADPKAQRARLIKGRDSVRSDPEEKLVAHLMDRGRWPGYHVFLFFGGLAP